MLKVLSWNIQAGRDINKKNSLKKQIEFLKSFDADVIFLQEVDIYTKRSNNINILKTIAEELGMYSVYGTDMALQGGWFGNAILSKEPIEFSMNFSIKGYLETRGILYSKIGEYHFFNTHYSRFPEYREIMSAEFIKILDNLNIKRKDKIVFGGDFNTSLYCKIENGHRSYFVIDFCPLNELDYLFANNFDEAISMEMTYPANRPKGTLDRFFIRKCEGNKYVHDTLLSDHKLIELQLE